MVSPMIRCVSLFVVLLLAGAPAWGTDPVSEWYLGLRGGAVYAGQDLDGNDGEAYAVDLTLIPSRRRMYELSAFSHEINFDAGPEVRHRGISFHWIEVNREPLWNPYFLLGGGLVQYDVAGERETDFAVNVAIGGMWELNSRGLMLRADARYRYGINGPDIPGESNAGDALVTIGLMLPFGVRLNGR